jgi:hypothetical protein
MQISNNAYPILAIKLNWKQCKIVLSVGKAEECNSPRSAEKVLVFRHTLFKSDIVPET